MKIALAALTLLISSPAFAQVDTGSVLGTVRDATGALVPAATVTLIHVDMGVSFQTKTNDVGLYQFPSVHIGAGLPPPPSVLDFSNTANFGRITALRLGPNDQTQIQLALKYYF
jgi:hypothetical protein